MKKFAVVFVFSLFLTSIAYAQDALTPATSETPAATEVAEAKTYFCPMDGFESAQPGKCEKCGMELVEKPVLTEEPVAEAEAAPAVAATE